MVDDSDALLRHTELVIACEVEAGFVSEMLTKERRRFELLELLVQPVVSESHRGDENRQPRPP